MCKFYLNFKSNCIYTSCKNIVAIHKYITLFPSVRHVILLQHELHENVQWLLHLHSINHQAIKVISF